MLESLVVVLVVCMLLFGFLQAALSLGGREVLHHAAARAARARSVGFNDWMAEKSMRVAAIPVSGRFLAEEVGWSKDEDLTVAEFERFRIPEYLASENSARAQYVLDYEEWEKGTLGGSETGSALGGGRLRFHVHHVSPLVMPFANWTFPWVPLDADGVPRMEMRSTAVAADHAGLYLR